MINESYKPRFSFEISPEQKQRADNLLADYGIRKILFTRILDDLLDLIEVHGTIIVGIIMSDKCKPHDIVPSMKRAELGAEKLGE